MRVTVVGAGVVGCAIAYELAHRGVRVRVLDPRGPGQGATQASAGMLAPYIEGHAPSLRRLGERSLALYDDFIQRVRSDSDLDVEYSRSGTLQVATSDTDTARLTALGRHLAEARVVHRLFDGAEVRRLEPALSADVQIALFIPSHGYVVASALLGALVKAASRLGVVFEDGHVSYVGSGAGGACVHTDTAHIQCDAAVMAAGSWSSLVSLGFDTAGTKTVVPAPQPPVVRPIRGQLLHLKTKAPVATRVMWGPGCYIVPWRDGSVLVGATVENLGFDDRPTAGGVQGLLNAAIEWLPALANAEFVGARAGLRPATGDELPVIGRSSPLDNMVYATGHFRNGVLLAPLTASLVADLVVDGQEGPGMEMVRPGRFGL